MVVDSSLASLNSLGSKPLRLDGILFLGKYHDRDGDDDDDDDEDDDDDDGGGDDLQWTEMGPSWPNCSLVLCT